MDRDKVESDVKKYLNQSLAGGSQEYAKFDFKAKWNDLHDTIELHKFLKISSAIANTPGEYGLIVYGYDEKSKTFPQAKLSDSGFNDNSKIIGIISRYVEDPFDIDVIDSVIDNHNLSIVIIPPSIEKPHFLPVYKSLDKNGMIKEEYQKIFIRKGSTTQVVNKNDLKFMIYDRKNIILDYQIFASISRAGLLKLGASIIIGEFDLTIENLGRRPISIRTIEIAFYHKPYYIRKPLILNLSSTNKKIDIINPGKSAQKKLEFNSSVNNLPDFHFANEIASLNKNYEEKYNSTVSIHLTNGKIISAHIEYFN